MKKFNLSPTAKNFPGVDLQDGENIELVLHPSKIIPILIWAGVALSSILCLVVLVFFNYSGTFGAVHLDSLSRGLMTLVIFTVMVCVLISALVSVRVYNGNMLYVTNKRLIQHSTTSLFNVSINIIDLVSIEDVSFKQKGIIDHIFGIGTLRMATVGDETTYTFLHADAPHNDLKTITSLVHQAKDKSSKPKDEDKEESKSETKDESKDESEKSED